jgi:hypothetical protein
MPTSDTTPGVRNENLRLFSFPPAFASPSDMLGPQSEVDSRHDAQSPSLSDDGVFQTQRDYSSRFRGGCTEVLHRLCPQDGNDSLPDWNKNDILELNTIFQVARVARVAGSKWLEDPTILRVLEKLITGSFFKAHRGPDGLVDMERHFRLLSSVLSLYKYENVSLDHHLRLKLLKGIQQLADSFEANRKNCSTEKQIENWNVAFLVHSCQSLMSSIKGSDSLTTSLARRATGVMDGALSGYGGQWVETKAILREITRIQRPGPKWHSEFVELEDLCFSLFAGGYKVWDGESNGKAGPDGPKYTSEQDEREITDRLCEVLEETLVEGDVGEFYTLLRNLRNGFGKATRLLFDSGVYEENSEYYHYGIMDLMMQMTYHVKDRGYCFKEFVRIVKTTLERSHPKANALHRKAVDLYRRIHTEGEHDRVPYGREDDIAVIELWINANRADIEEQEASFRYVVLRVVVDIQSPEKKHR